MDTENPARDTYIAGIDPAFVPAVLALDRAVMAADVPFDIAIKYKMLTYTLNRDFRRWICAIDVTRKAFHLRFLYGVLLDDPRGILRAGTSTLKTIDFKSIEDIDPQLVTDYVKEAVSRLETFKAQPEDRKQKP